MSFPYPVTVVPTSQFQPGVQVSLINENSHIYSLQVQQCLENDGAKATEKSCKVVHATRLVN